MAHRVWGDLQRSRYFQIDAQPDITLLIRSLSVTAKADVLGRSFQGNAAVRAVSEADHLRLLAYADSLPLEPRARLLPEEKLEALLLAGDEDAVAEKNDPVRRSRSSDDAVHCREQAASCRRTG